MHYVFGSCFGCFGNAILSKYPIEKFEKFGLVTPTGNDISYHF
jgi:hypothetical protein